MRDQADSLRLRMQATAEKVPRTSRKLLRAHTIAVTSGKGGVGKTNFTLNFSMQLAKSGYQTVVFDADFGFANMDVLMDMTPRRTLYDLLQPGVTVYDVMERGPNGLYCVPGRSSVQEWMDLAPEQGEYLVAQLKELQDFADFIIVDTGAGLTKESLSLILAADETILVTTPEPTAITDGYAVIKYLFTQRDSLKLWTVINRAANCREGERTGQKMCFAVKQFLHRDVQMLGYLPDHVDVVRAVKRQRPFSECFPNSPVTRRLELMTKRYLAEFSEKGDEGNQGFMRYLLNAIRRRT